MRRIMWVIMIALICWACSTESKDPQAAIKVLKSIQSWNLDQITVNDVVTFKDGQVQEQFGGIEFTRYMETVKFEEDGTFRGFFVNDTKPFLLNWTVSETDIKIREKDEQIASRFWLIKPQDVHSDSFLMKIKSTAYDYPNTTEISLKFKSTK